ncbi:MAG TPA: YdcF family protein, partial [Nitrospirota bacterium]|nr:YdcF family protein [Nitrospirota bacterium]
KSAANDNAKHEKAGAIVVLGGGVRDLSWLKLEPLPSEMSIERLIAGVKLYKELHIPLVIIGGNGNPFEQEIKEADAMGRVAKSIGIPDKDIITDNAPRNTLESASAAKRLIKGDRIILVTSAYHMKRSSAMFRKQGFDVVPAPAGYKSEQRGLSLYSCIPRAGSLNDSSTALAEYLSLFLYTITGSM